MKTIKVWDLPTRLLHWGLAASVSAALLIAFTAGKHSPQFQLHMLFGLLAGFFVLLRVVWGVIGKGHASFSRFPLGPQALAAYARSLLQPGAARYTGHNPGAAWAALLMLVLVLALVLTGLGREIEALEEAHEALAYTLLAVIGLHLAGLILHTFQHRENIAASMVTGRKAGDPAQEIPSVRPVWATGLLAAAAAWVAALFTGHDPRAGTVRLPVLGTVVQLGEREGGGGEPHRGKHRRGHDDDGD